MRWTPRTAYLLALCAPLALLGSPRLMVIAMGVVAAAATVDALAVRTPPEVTRTYGSFARGISTPLTISVKNAPGSHPQLRQPLPPDMASPGPTADSSELRTVLVPQRRGRFLLPQVAVRLDGPLGLGRWHHEHGDEAPIKVYPDVPGAQRLAQAVRQRSIRAAGSRRNGPLGLGTDFEAIRNYRTDDDVRQINWKATGRLGTPMSNVLRVEQDTDLWIVADRGRLSGASLALPSGPATHLDVALDIATALGLVADDLGDRVGFVPYAADPGKVQMPRRRGGGAVVESCFDLEPSDDDSDHAAAFASVTAKRRGLIFLLTDIVDASATEMLAAALPTLTRRHHVILVAIDDPAHAAMRRAGTPGERLVMQDIDAALTESSRLVQRAGADVLFVPAEQGAEIAVRAYVKARTGATVSSSVGGGLRVG